MEVHHAPSRHRRCNHGLDPPQEGQSGVPGVAHGAIESTHAAYEAGTTLVRIHVRNDDESPSLDPDRFATVQAGVRKHCPGMIVQTGGR
jgi:uncharacterized protein (DUF849 family)